jgi:isopentenyl-diphosphate delta-isomerase
MMKEPFVTLVDENDNITGTLGKQEAHQKALLHRAISVFIINSKGEWILQRRAKNKYHSNGLWTNTCCSHPFPGETSHEAAIRRLHEEMGLHCKLQEVFTFIYKEKLDNGLTEHELDHVFIGISEDLPVINKHEVMEWRAVSYDDLKRELEDSPFLFTTWFRHIHKQVNSCIIEMYNENISQKNQAE